MAMVSIIAKLAIILPVIGNRPSLTKLLSKSDKPLLIKSKAYYIVKTLQGDRWVSVYPFPGNTLIFKGHFKMTHGDTYINILNFDFLKKRIVHFIRLNAKMKSTIVDIFDNSPRLFI
jgi:hypothetical protein